MYPSADRLRMLEHQRKSTTEHKGRAVGGPRDGVTLAASENWDGLMRDHYEHRYEWDGTFWRWVPYPRHRPLRTGRPPKQKQQKGR